MADSPTPPFGDLLRRHCLAAGLTQAELAERAGLSERGLNDLERGARQSPRKDTVALLAEALDLTGEERTAFIAAARRASSLGRGTTTASAANAAPADTGASVAALPSGTVTFLFTDVEGSTRLLQRLGDRYAQVLADYQRIVRRFCGPRRPGSGHPGRQLLRGICPRARRGSCRRGGSAGARGTCLA